MLDLTHKTRRTVYLDGTDLEREGEALMRFRLTYSGPLLSSNPAAPEKRIEHKHDIRRKIHPQLRELWRTSRPLADKTIRPDPAYWGVLPPNAESIFADMAPKVDIPYSEALARCYEHCGYRYVPLVRKEIDLTCAVRVLVLRRDIPGAVLPGRDIDNRIKTLIDALTMPAPQQGPPMKNGAPLLPDVEEDPFYVLLDDDRRISHLEVETDTALEVSDVNPSDESFVRLVATIEIRPTRMTIFNLDFA